MAFGTPVVGTTAYSASGGTSVAPTYPASIVATDQLVMTIGQKPSTANSGTVTTPSGWTLRESLTAAGGYGATLGADTGNTNVYIYTKDVVTAGLSGTVTVTVATNNVCWANITRVPTGGGAISYGSADGQRTTTPTSPLSVALTNGASATAFQAGDFAIWGMCIPTDVTTPAQFSAHTLTSSGITFNATAELVEPDSTTGNDIGGYVAYVTVATGSAGGAPTVGATLAGTLTNVRGPIALLRLREAVLPTIETTPGSYSLTGSSGTLTRDLALAGAAGSLALTGSSTELVYVPAAQAFELLTDPGSYSLTGSNTTLAAAFALNSTAGSYTTTGSSVAFAATWALSATAGSYSITGSTVELVYAPAAVNFDLIVTPGSYALTGSDVTFRNGWVLSATPDSYGLTGSNATLVLGYTLNVDTNYFTDYYVDDYIGDGHYALTGPPVILNAPYWPLPSTVRAGVTYGPTGADYVGTLVGGITVDVRTGIRFKTVGQRGTIAI